MVSICVFVVVGCVVGACVIYKKKKGKLLLFNVSTDDGFSHEYPTLLKNVYATSPTVSEVQEDDGDHEPYLGTVPPRPPPAVEDPPIVIRLYFDCKNIDVPLLCMRLPKVANPHHSS